MKTIAVVGAGQRGQYAYGNYVLKHSQDVKIIAVAEIDEYRRMKLATDHQIHEDKIFDNTDDFFNAGKLADACIIATMDRDHHEHTLKAIALGYDILLEKPISVDKKECIEMIEAAEKRGVLLMVCHVLRYTSFFQKIKDLIKSGAIGDIVSIQHNENIGIYHMAHSFVRGNWRNSDETSSIILQKSCHDLDILSYLVDSDVKSITSTGELRYFKESCAPMGSSDRCVNCHVEDCIFDARKAYLPMKGYWPSTVVSNIQSDEAIMEALRTGPYGRCVFHSDNNVCDHQATLIEFSNGVSATFNLCAFTDEICRTIKIMGTKGVIGANDDQGIIEVKKFRANAFAQSEKTVYRAEQIGGGHNGGDTGLMDHFIKALHDGNHDVSSSARRSLQSHLMAFAAEESRLKHQRIELYEEEPYGINRRTAQGAD